MGTTSVEERLAASTTTARQTALPSDHLDGILMDTRCQMIDHLIIPALLADFHLRER